ncbi:MAG: extracellular solute-binding protein, partial [Candidatus Bathyarchaeia archaeon]
VTVTADGYSVTTGPDGTYSLTVDVGSYTVSVSLEGYEEETSPVDATEEKTYTVDFTLTPIPPPKPTEVVLKVITRHGSDITFTAEQLFLKSEFAKKHNIVDIKWIPQGPTLWVETIKRTGDIDLGWGGGPVLFDIILREGLLAPLTSDEVEEALTELPDAIGGAPVKRYDQGEVYWVGSALASFGFTINMEYLEDMRLPEPTRWIDLANETYAVTLPSPSIGTADATKSTSNTRMFEIILQGHGWQGGWKLLTLKGANARIFDRSESVRDAAIIGEIGVGTTIDFYGYTAQLENPGICKYVLPQDGTIVNADPIALLKTSPNAEAAQSFIAWVISAEGQKPWLSPKINRLPINPKVFDTPEGKERADLKEVYEKTKEALIIPFSDDLALSYEYSLMNFYHATIVRPQLKLSQTWMELTEAKFDGKITHAQFMELTDKLGDPHLFEFTDPDTGSTVTFTQEYAQSINDRMMTDATFRTEMIDTWMRAAEARYDSVLAELKSLTG